jgi:DNA modification methylase
MEKNKIYFGDCFEVMKNFSDNSVDFVFTSPPYNRKRNDKYSYYDDTIADYFSFLEKAILESLRICRGYVCFNIQKNYYNKQDVFKIIGKFSNKIQEIIIWEKKNPMPASGFSITNSYEFFIIFGDKPLKSNTTYTKNIISTGVNSKMPKEHKAVMKQEVADWFISKFTTVGELVLDPFIGLGTTAISCIKLQRNYIGIELKQEYFNLCQNKIHNLKTDTQK